MNALKRYKELSNIDKTNLTRYCIFQSIYDTARNENIELDDEIVLNIEEISSDLYLDDEYYNLSASKISDFITICYAKDNRFLEKLNDIDYSDILEAINDSDYDFYKDLEMER